MLENYIELKKLLGEIQFENLFNFQQDDVTQIC